MLLSELPAGATFQFEDSAIEVINQHASRYDVTSGGASRNPYRIQDAKLSLLKWDGPYHKGTRPVLTPANSFNHFELLSPADKLEVNLLNAAPPLFKDTFGLPSRALFTTSCDPEIFLENVKGEIVPAFSVLPHKGKPELISDTGSYYEDGFQAEFSPLPQQCHERATHFMMVTMSALLTRARWKDAGVRFSSQNFVEFPKAQLDAATDEQVSLGCEPSENIYGTPPFVVDNARQFPYRMAGGHIHLGSKAIATWLHSRAEPIITAMDAFVGVGSVALFEGMEDPRRRLYYGRAGEFRFQPHGLEYRTLSNAWLVSSPIAHLILNLARGAFRMGFTEWREVLKLDSERIKTIIDTYDVQEARKFITEHVKQFVWLLNNDSGCGWGNKAIKLLYQGLPSALPNWKENFAMWPAENSFQQAQDSFVYARSSR